MNKKVIIQIPFNVQGFNKKNELDDKWIRYRLMLFVNYNLKSLKAQTNQHFTALLRCRDETIPRIKELISKELPENVQIVRVQEYKEKVKELIKDYNYLYLVRMDSDDLYVNAFVDTIQNYSPNPETEVLISQDCYTYDINQKRLAYFFYHSPQSYVLIYKTIEYNRGKRYYLKNGHGGAWLLKHELILGVNYMDTVHQRNDSSYFEGKTGGKKRWCEIQIKEDIAEILNNFGIGPGEGGRDEQRKQ